MESELTQSPPREWPKAPAPYTVDQFLDVVERATKIDRSALVPSASMADLNIASLDMVEMLFEFEEKFDVYIPMGDELSKVDYLADLVAVLVDLMERGGGQGAGPAL